MLALKLILVPVLIAALSVVAHRFGPVIAGLLTGFPMVAGPIFLFLVAEHGAAFGYQAAVGTLVGLTGLAVYALCYSWSSRRCNWAGSLALGWAAFLLVSLPLERFQPNLALACLVALAMPTMAPRLFPAAQPPQMRRALPRSEILLRMLAAAALVLAITKAATVTGPRLAGLLTPFPVASSVVTAFSHRLYGPDTAILLLRGMVVGLYGFVAFFAITAALLPVTGIVLSALAGFVAAVAIQGLLYLRAIRARK
ncbi:MAG: hypothetical protein AB1768_16230 [Pseudomonadota bacterium]|jgi:hypothetical protein